MRLAGQFLRRRLQLDDLLSQPDYGRLPPTHCLVRSLLQMALPLSGQLRLFMTLPGHGLGSEEHRQHYAVSRRLDKGVLLFTTP
jgi:hypothetical protein